MQVNFKSDNLFASAPSEIESFNVANQSISGSYGEDEFSQQLHNTFTELCGRPAKVFVCSTGTATNIVGLTAVNPKASNIVCSSGAHINCDEASAIEWATGSKLVPVPNSEHKIDPDLLARTLSFARDSSPHSLPIHTLALTQATEAMTTYNKDELLAIRSVCDLYKVRIHVDGARIANSLAFLGCELRDFVEWLKPDSIAFGGTKNGAIIGEWLLILNPELFELARFVHKRCGQLQSKTKFLAAAALDFLKQDWLGRAKVANKYAKEVEQIFLSFTDFSIWAPVEANGVFVTMKPNIADRIAYQGVEFYKWNSEGTLCRFMCSYSHKPEDMILLRNHLEKAIVKRKH